MDEILNLIESVSEGFPTYSFVLLFHVEFLFLLQQVRSSFLFARSFKS